MSECLWMLYHDIGQGMQIVISALPVIFLASKGRQPQKNLGCNTVASRSGIIHNILGTTNQRFVVATSIEKATIPIISEQCDSLIHQPARLREPVRIKAGFV